MSTQPIGQTPCSHCKGTGKTNAGEECPHCRGKGLVPVYPGEPSAVDQK